MCAFSCLLPDGDALWGSIFQETSWNAGGTPLQPELCSSSFDSQPTPTGTDSSGGGSGHGFKKLNHNASERHRRKKINSLYSSLRSLLPPADQSSPKLSIPNTVDRVVKYIPELQNEVDKLARKKEELSSRSRDRNVEDEKRRPAKRSCNNRRISEEDLPAVSATRLGNDQIAIQICEHPNLSTLSSILDCMEEDGFSLLSLSSFHSSPSPPTVFYHLHFLQMKRSGQVEPQDVRSKLLSLYYEKGDKATNKFCC